MAFPRLPLALVGLVGCAAARPAPSSEPVAREPAPASSAAAPAPPSPVLRRTHTGQAVPRVVVRNAFLRVQHVFIDWRPVGSVAVHSSATFDVPVGTHTITCADSSELTDNPGSVTELFESGFTYTYEILAQ